MANNKNQSSDAPNFMSAPEKFDADATETGFGGAGIDTGAGNPNGNSTVKTNVPNSRALAITEPPSSSAVSRMIKDGSLQSPYYNQIKQNLDRKTILETMPMRDENGRLKSGLKGLLSGLGTYFDPKFGLVKNWGDFGARLAGAGAKGASGAIFSDWDERADRDREIARIDQQNDELLKFGDKDWQMRQQTANLALGQQKADTQAELGKDRVTLQREQFEERKTQNKFNQLEKEKQDVLKQIFSRGYYYEGDNPSEDAALSKYNIVLPDFDSLHKPLKNNGVDMSWNPQSRAYEQSKGTSIDPDDEPVTFSVDGQDITASRKYFLNYKAKKEARESQQNFTGKENDKNRAIKMRALEQRITQYRAASAAEYATKRASVVKSKEAGDLSPDEADKLLEILDRNNPGLK